MILVSTYIANSDIHGVGLFTGEPIKKDSKVWEFDPRHDIFLHESEMFDNLESIAYRHPEFPGLVFVDSDNLRYMNHSENPNTGRGLALRDIKKGEELTTNYKIWDNSQNHINSR